MYNPFKLYEYDSTLQSPWWGWWDHRPSISETKRWKKAIEEDYVTSCRIMMLIVPTPGLDSNPPAIE